ncbi:MAG: PrsW family glutamic-type intramembrane protease [Myxococcota bacterium]
MPDSLISIFLACFAPAVFWLGYWYYRANIGERRLGPVLGFFGAGLLSGPVALGLFTVLELSPFYEQLATIDDASEVEKFAYALFAIGPVEELSKFLVAWAAMRAVIPNAEPLGGGLVYAAAAALGFATIENWYYMLEVDKVVWHRPLTLPFNHVLFSSFWGVGLSLYHLRPRGGMLWLTAGLVLSFIYHGLYDYILLSSDIPGYYVLPLVLGLWIWLMLAIPRLRDGIRHAKAREPAA